MAKGDFAKHIQPKITRPNCDSCGQSNWDVLEEINSEAPVVTLHSLTGNFHMPPSSLQTALTICKNCGYTRTYMLPAPTSAKGTGQPV